MIIARGAVGQLMHMIRVVDKMILGIEKLHAGGTTVANWSN